MKTLLGAQTCPYSSGRPKLRRIKLGQPYNRCASLISLVLVVCMQSGGSYRGLLLWGCCRCHLSPHGGGDQQCEAARAQALQVLSRDRYVNFDCPQRKHSMCVSHTFLPFPCRVSSLRKMLRHRGTHIC